MGDILRVKKCCDAAFELMDLGFSIIPIRRDESKKPLIPWKEFQTRRADEEEVSGWFKKWPDANIAIVTGAISGVFVVDADGEIGSQWVIENLPKSTVYAQTGRVGGCHCYYRIPSGINIKTEAGYRPKVDIRGEGGYVVAPPSIHHLGRAYEWKFRDGFNAFDEMPELNPYKVGKSQGGGGDFGRALNLDLSKIKTASEKAKPTTQGNRNQAMTEMVGMLFNKGLPPETVIELAMGHNSRFSPPMSEKEVKAVVASIYKTHVKNHPSAELEMNAARAEIKSDPVITPIVGPKNDAAPVEMLQPGGIIQEAMDFIEQSSAASIPLFNLGAAVTMLGAVAGQRVCTETGLRTNLYTISLGYSGSGKNAPVSAVPQILMNSTAALLQGPTEIASAAGIQKWLASESHHSTLVILDEIGMLLKGLRNPNSPLSEIPRVLTKLFSGTDRSERKTYADEKLNFVIPWHHLAIYGASTPEEFWASLTEGDSVNGFLARFHILENRMPSPLPKQVQKIDPPKKLIDAISGVWGIEPKTDAAAGNLQIARGEARPIPHRIPKNKKAQDLFDPFAKKYHQLSNDWRSDGCRSSIYARVAEHAHKLALIHAISLHGAKIVDKEVGPDSVSWAIKYAEFCCEHTINGIRSHLAQNEYHKTEQRMIRHLKNAAEKTPENPGLLLSVLFSKMVGITRKTFDEVLVGLKMKGKILEQQGKKSPILVAVETDE